MKPAFARGWLSWLCAPSTSGGLPACDAAMKVWVATFQLAVWYWSLMSLWSASKRLIARTRERAVVGAPIRLEAREMPFRERTVQDLGDDEASSSLGWGGAVHDAGGSWSPSRKRDQRKGVRS